jgi:hypothetical protein
MITEGAFGKREKMMEKTVSTDSVSAMMWNLQKNTVKCQ